MFSSSCVPVVSLPLPQQRSRSRLSGLNMAEDADDWDRPEEPMLSQQSSVPDSSHGSETEVGSPQKKKKTKEKNRGRGSAAKSPKNKKILAKNCVFDRACFICPNKKKANSRFCLVHNPPAEVIKSQAVAKNELQAYESVMYSKEKAALAIGQFMMDSPPGKFRKKLIDFAQWKKAYGVRTSMKVNDNESEFTAATWQTYAVNTEGYSEDGARLRWKEMAKDANLERSGEGAAMKIWVVTVRARQRTRERYEDAAFEESSKQMKNLENTDVDALKTFALSSSANAMNSSFLRSTVGAEEPDSEARLPALSDVTTKKRRLNLSVAGPKASSKQASALAKFKGQIDKEATELNAAATFYEEWRATNAGAECPREVLLYKRVLDVNKGLLCLWVVEDHLSPEVVSQIQTQAAQPNPGTTGASAKSTPIHGVHMGSFFPGLPVPATPAARGWDAGADASPLATPGPTPET